MGTYVYKSKNSKAVKPLSRNRQYVHDGNSVDYADAEPYLQRKHDKATEQQTWTDAAIEAEQGKMSQGEAYDGEHADLAGSRNAKPLAIEIFNEPDLGTIETFNYYPEEQDK